MKPYLLILTAFAGAWFAMPESFALAQSGNQQNVQGPVPAHPDSERIQQWISENRYALEKARLSKDIAIQKDQLDLLIERQQNLPSIIKSKSETIQFLNDNVSGPTEYYYQHHDNLFVEMFDNMFGNYRRPLTIYDVIEDALPEFEQKLLKEMKESGASEIKYTDKMVLKFAIGKMEDDRDKEKAELESLPKRVAKQKQLILEMDLELARLNVLETEIREKNEAENGVIRTRGTGELHGKTLKRSHLQECGNGDPDYSMKLPFSSMKQGLGGQTFDFMGLTMECSNLEDGLKVDFQMACNKFSGAAPPMTARNLPSGVPVCWPNNRKWGPPKPGEAGWGINSTSLTGVCYEAYYGRPANQEEMTRIVPLIKYAERALSVECFFIERKVIQTLLASN